MSTADDRWDILELLHRAAHAVDSGDFDAYGELFARASVTIGSDTRRGREDIASRARATVILHEGSPRTNHLVQNAVIEIDAEGRTARVTSYVQVVQGVPPDFPLQTIGTARYRDLLHHDADGWYFLERVAEVMLVGDLSRHSMAALPPDRGRGRSRSDTCIP
jgi:hypothetical protein